MHTGVLMAKCALLTWGHRPECTLFLRVIGQSAQFILKPSTRVHTFFQGPRPGCTLFLRDIDQCAYIFLGLFMSAHIFHASQSSRLCRECTHFQIYQLPSCPKIPDPGSALRVLAGVQEGGGGVKINSQ